MQSEQKATRKKKLFRFEAFWVKEDECKKVMRGAWVNRCEGTPLQRWNKKINDCRTNLTRWNIEKFK